MLIREVLGVKSAADIFGVEADATVAEAVRFELTNVAKRCRFSRPVQSTTLPRFQRARF